MKMNVAKLRQWMNENPIDAPFLKQLAAIESREEFAIKGFGKDPEDSNVATSRSQPLIKCRPDPEIEFIDRKISVGLELDNKLRELALFISQSRSTNRSLNDTKNQIFSSVKAISERSSELFAEKSNLSHLRLEIDMNRAYFIDMETFKVKMAFINEVRQAPDFYKYSDNYILIIQKAVQSFAFFSNRKSFRDSAEQLDKYSHLIRRASESIARIFESYHLPYFDQFRQLTTSAFLQSQKIWSELFQNQSLHPNFKVKHMIVPYFKLLHLLKIDLTGDAFNQMFGEKLTDSEEKIKSSLQKIGNSLELQTKNSDKIQELFRFFFIDPAFEEFRKPVWNFYSSNYLRHSLKTFELICACEKELMLTISYMLMDVILTVAHLGDYLSESYFKSEGFNSSMSSYVSSLINAFKQRIKNEDDFNLIITIFRLVIASHQIANIMTNDANEIDKTNPVEGELRLYVYKKATDRFEDSTLLDSNLGFFGQQLMTGLCEALLFQTEYMLNKIVNQQWKSPNNSQEVSNFDLSKKSTLVQEFSKAFKVFDYICNSLESLSYGYDNFKGYIYKLALLTMKRVLESASLIQDDLIRFAYKFKNLYAIFRKLSKDVSYESIYEFHEMLCREEDLIAQIDKELNKQSIEYLYLFCAQLMSRIVNNEAIRLSNFFCWEVKNHKALGNDQWRVIEKTLNEVKLKLTLSLHFEALEAARATFLPSLINSSTQGILALAEPEQIDSINRAISGLFSLAFSSDYAV